MRFKIRQYRYGSLRTVKKFAWLPVRIEDCYVWFEFYHVQQSYIGSGIGFNWYEMKSTRQVIKK